jgi:hypothetical protein
VIEQCTERGCTKQARVAIATARTKRDDLKSTIHYDNRTAPKKAARYCREHGASLAAELIRMVADGDEDMPTTEVT